MNDREQYVCADDVSNCYSVLEKHNSHKSHVKVFFLQYECADDVSNDYCQRSTIHTSDM